MRMILSGITICILVVNSAIVVLLDMQPSWFHAASPTGRLGSCLRGGSHEHMAFGVRLDEPSCCRVNPKNMVVAYHKAASLLSVLPSGQCQQSFSCRSHYSQHSHHCQSFTVSTNIFSVRTLIRNDTI